MPSYVLSQKIFAIFLLSLSTIFFTMTSQNANAASLASDENLKKILSQTTEKENTMVILLKDGPVIVKMLPKIAPAHVARIKELVKQKFYDGIKFHRVIDGFMAQTGDPTGTGMGGSGKNIKAEFNSHPHKRGVLSMARAMSPDSADSQFFIVFKDSNFLDGQYTAWGEVTSGMQYVDKIKRGAGGNGEVSNPDKMLEVKMAEDILKK